MCCIEKKLPVMKNLTRGGKPNPSPSSGMHSNMVLYLPSLLVSFVVINRSSSGCTPLGNIGIQHPAYSYDVWECQLTSGAWFIYFPLLRALKFLTSPKDIFWFFLSAHNSPCCLLPAMTLMAIITVLWNTYGQIIAVCSTPWFAKAQFPFSAWDLNFWNVSLCRDLEQHLSI